MYSLITENTGPEIAKFVINEQQYQENNKMHLQRTALKNPDDFITKYDAFVNKLPEIVGVQPFYELLIIYADKLSFSGNHKELLGEFIVNSIPEIFNFVASFDIIKESMDKMRIVDTK